jgi:hypothetical protein
MPSDTSFKSWTVGILGAVITAVLIFVIEQKLTNTTSVQTPAHTTQGKTPRDTIIHVAGQVLDASKHVLENVRVTVQVATYDKSQSTDSLGRYNLSVENVNPDLSGSIRVQASGFKTVTYNETLQEMSNRESVVLDAISPAPPGGVGATPGGVVIHPAVAQYVKRPDFARLVVARHP